MKQLFLFACVLITGTLFSQQYRQAIGNATQLKIVDMPAILELHASDGVDLEISYIAEDGKPIAVQGNGGIGLQVQSAGTTIEIKGLLSKRLNGRYVLQVPRKLALDIRSEGLMGDLTGEGITGDINIITAGNVTLENMGGGITVQSGDGNVVIKKPVLSRSKPVSVITQAGNVEITLQSGVNADLKLGTATGHITLSYSNSKNFNMLFAGKSLNTPLGKGGTALQVQTLSGNVSVHQAQ